MEEGYIKLYRQILESRVFKNPTALKIWIWCLAKASYKERVFQMKTGRGYTEVNVSPGSFVFGRKKAAEFLDTPESTFYDWIKKFASTQYGMIDLISNNHYSIITLRNWSEYQSENTQPDKQPDKQPTGNTTSNQQPTNRQPDTNKKEKKVNKEKNSLTREGEREDFLQNADYAQCVGIIELHYKNMQRQNPEIMTGHRIEKEQSWKVIAALLEVDGFSEVDIKKALAWATRDAFWQPQVITLKALRDKCQDGRTKFQQMHARMVAASQKVNGNGHDQPQMVYKRVEPASNKIKAEYARLDALWAAQAAAKKAQEESNNTQTETL